MIIPTTEYPKIINEYQDGVGYGRIARMYHTNDNNIKNILISNNIIIRKPSTMRTDDDKVIKMYQSGAGTSKIAKILDCNPLVIRKVLKRNNIKFRSLAEYRTYQMDPIDLITPKSELTSYWFGFFLADAFLAKYRNQIRCNLALRDIGHLFLLAKDIRSNYQPKKCWKPNSKSSMGGHSGSYLSVNHGALQQFYLDNGWDDHRSGNIEAFKKHLKAFDIRHLLRGLWDGDGCVSIFTEKHKSGCCRYLRMGYIDNQRSCVEWVRDRLCSTLQITPNKIMPNSAGGAYYVVWTGSPAVKIARYLYCGSTRYLQRKLDKVLPYITKQENK
jgi:hypothetical protein